MKKFISTIVFAGCVCACTVDTVGHREPESFVQNMQGRDTVLIADRLRFGGTIYDVPDGSDIQLPPDFSIAGVELVRGWKLDTLRSDRERRTKDMEASVLVTSFEEGEYFLPPFNVGIAHPDGSIDSLYFEGQDILVSTMDVDTASFVVKPLKFQKTYPVTMKEKLPSRLAILAFALISYAIYRFVRRRKKKKEEASHVDPPHIVALRKLDGYRGDSFWKPEEQKLFYSGVTDALREYISARFGIGAMEMTTAEIIEALRHEDEISDDLKAGLKSLFEDADFVKFAKGVFDNEHNAKVLPFGVNFVTSTYQEQLSSEQQAQEREKMKKEDVENVL